MSGVPITVPALPVVTPNANDIVPLWDVLTGIQGRTTLAGVVAGVGDAQTWVPQLQFGGANVGMGDASKGGFYYKLDKFVYLSGFLTLTTKGSSVGVATIAGLPFISQPGVGRRWMIQLQLLNPDATLTGVPMGYISSNNQTMNLGMQPSAASFTNIANTHLAATSTIYFSGMYETP